MSPNPKTFSPLSHPFLIILLTLSMYSCNDKHQTPSLQINFTGDVILDRGVSTKLQKTGGDTLAKHMSHWLNGHYNVINLEGTLTDSGNPRQKKFLFRSNPEKAQQLKQAGVTHAGISNNHSLDYGGKGFEETLQSLKSENIMPLGTDCKPVILEKNDQQCALITASTTTRDQPFCCQKDHNLQKTIKKFSAESPNIPLIIYFHWGIEYQPTPSEKQRKLAKGLIQSGADAILGHHPHVIQSVEMIKGKPVIYSLGNFVADANNPKTTKGLAAQLQVTGDSLICSLLPVNLSSYFPKAPTNKGTLKLFMRQVNLHEGTVFYTRENQGWHFKPADQIHFREPANTWLFGGLNGYQVMVRKLKSGNHKLSLWQDGEYQSAKTLNGKVKQLKLADINQDHEEELLISLVKAVRFDQQMRLRLNVFREESGNLQTMWLGTRFMYDLKTFDVIQKLDTPYLRTYEEDSSNNTYKGTYVWDEMSFQQKSMKKIDHEPH